MKGGALKVLLVSPLPPPNGGIATWTERILRYPVPDDIERAHFNIAPRQLQHFSTGIGLTYVTLQARLAARFFLHILRLRPSVVHITSSYDRAFSRDALFIAWARMLGSNVVLNLRGGDFERFFRSSSKWAQKRIKQTLRRCDMVVPITRATETFLRELGGIRVRLIPNCIDISSEDPPKATTAIRRWLYVGWIIPSKGIPELIECLDAFPEARLTLVGPIVEEGGRESIELMERLSVGSHISQRVTHIPSMGSNEVRRTYRAHDLFVFPSRREGFPNVILEAMDAGIPIVTTSVGAIPEIVRQGVDALLVPPNSVPALRAAVKQLTDDPTSAARLAASARNRVAANFAMDHVADMWFALYREVAHATRPLRAPHLSNRRVQPQVKTAHNTQSSSEL